MKTPNVEPDNRQPWYREPWPWIIITLLGSTIVACLVTISLAIRSAEAVLPH